MSDDMPTPAEWQAHQAFHRLTVAQRDAAWREIERLRQTQLPEGMTAKKLRYVARWLDTFDRLARNYFDMHETMLGTPAEELAKVRRATEDKSVQADLRRWADDIDHHHHLMH